MKNEYSYALDVLRGYCCVLYCWVPYRLLADICRVVSGVLDCLFRMCGGKESTIGKLLWNCECYGGEKCPRTRTIRGKV